MMRYLLQTSWNALAFGGLFVNVRVKGLRGPGFQAFRRVMTWASSAGSLSAPA